MLRPDPQFAAGINADICRRLTGALDYLICDIVGEARRPERWSTGPVAHALQAAMREAAAADDVEAIRNLYAAHGSILSQPNPPEPCQVIGWGATRLGPSETTLLQAAFRDDIGLTARLAAPDSQTVATVRETVASLRAKLQTATPLWSRELHELVSTILLATADRTAQDFSGASAFAAWGAILVNPVVNETPRQLALTLIHESSHLKLFSAYLDDEIVLNDPAETYASPLRHEARPMNGIFHAAFVLARMILFSTDLLASGQADAVLGAGETSRLAADRDRSTRAFDAAHGVITEHGDLTPTGREIIAECADAVASVAARQLA